MQSHADDLLTHSYDIPDSKVDVAHMNFALWDNNDHYRGLTNSSATT